MLMGHLALTSRNPQLTQFLRHFTKTRTFLVSFGAAADLNQKFTKLKNN